MLLETVTGKLVDPSNPQVEQIDIEDIAWALSRISRFCGHTITVQPYTVAHHSVFVAEKVAEMLDNNDIAYITDKCVRNQLILKALLHDAAESYIGDLPSPIKRVPELHSVIKRIETNLMQVIYQACGVSPLNESEEKIIKCADKFAQRVEAHAFMQSRGRHWEGLPNVSLEDLQRFPQPLSSLDSYKLFLKKFNELTEKGEKCN